MATANKEDRIDDAMEIDTTEQRSSSSTTSSSTTNNSRHEAVQKFLQSVSVKDELQKQVEQYILNVLDEMDDNKDLQTAANLASFVKLNQGNFIPDAQKDVVKEASNTLFNDVFGHRKAVQKFMQSVSVKDELQKEVEQSLLKKLNKMDSNKDLQTAANLATFVDGIQIFAFPDAQEDVVKEACDTLFNDVFGQGGNGPAVSERTVYVDYNIEETNLSHPYDLNSFSKHVETLAQEYWNSTKQSDGIPRYVAPYFVLVQSSGMGKTKLLYEYRESCNSKHDQFQQFEAKMILCGNIRTSQGSSLYDSILPTQVNGDSKGLNEEDRTEKRLTEAERIFKILDELFSAKGCGWKKNTHKYRVLLFDEAQNLLKEAFGMQAFFFRCLRLWLRQRRRDRQYVAVFTGTSSGLTNFDIESDHDLVRRHNVDSRGMGGKQRDFIKKGGEVFPHFVRLTTMGCQLQQSTDSDEGDSDYERSIAYGRPLFTIMDRQGDLPGLLPNILRRMMLEKGKDGTVSGIGEDLKAWLSILATRVQMGVTTVAIASDLVKKGYANLTHVSRDFAYFTYFPDPVCARLAMGMMKEGWKVDSSCRIKGKPPRDWVQKLGQIYSSGLCRPEKGDFGEVLTSLYFLLCADALRDEELETFSVGFDEWVEVLCRGGRSESGVGESKRDQHSRKRKTPQEQKTKFPISLSCIQFCRNFLRSYQVDWSSFGDQKFLSSLYRSGTGIFTFAGCRLIDGMIPLRRFNGNQPVFFPLLVSIKSHIYFPPGAAAELANEMVDKAESSGLTHALCLVVVFGQTTKSDDNNLSLNANTVKELVEKGLVPAVFRIPANDEFGTTQQFLELTGATQATEVYASHPFIRAYGKAGQDTPDPLDPKYALRVCNEEGHQDSASTMFKTLAEQLRK